MSELTAAEIGVDRFDTLVACLAMLGEPINVENEPRPGLEVGRELASNDARWARIVLDIIEGKREMPRDLDPQADDPIAASAWHFRGAIIVGAAGRVPEFSADDRRVLEEILVGADDSYDGVLERVSAGCLTPETKHALLVAPLRTILDAS